MATVIIYNNDVQGALRALKKEQQNSLKNKISEKLNVVK